MPSPIQPLVPRRNVPSKSLCHTCSERASQVLTARQSSRVYLYPGKKAYDAHNQPATTENCPPAPAQLNHALSRSLLRTSRGTSRSSSEPTPSWPDEFIPVAYAFHILLIKIVWSVPHATWIILPTWGTCVGRRQMRGLFRSSWRISSGSWSWAGVKDMPSCPPSIRPHTRHSPVAVTAAE